MQSELVGMEEGVEGGTAPLCGWWVGVGVELVGGAHGGRVEPQPFWEMPSLSPPSYLESSTPTGQVIRGQRGQGALDPRWRPGPGCTGETGCSPALLLGGLGWVGDWG